eukprot:CAMPEP_0118649150 /NCGR_PEP_ID=MMETSP0785-20121206/9548_1 /TAXON_ID=91992 /ORGANISM="Bolidomonas pacifica, Strain CCMP 1866" /LENGTH=67 /DNA_ID=CAMNT_0006541415 /DNA_START=911 /DNA_END=1114 /DNA_ORIENTATION=+
MNRTNLHRRAIFMGPQDLAGDDGGDGDDGDDDDDDDDDDDNNDSKQIILSSNNFEDDFLTAKASSAR